MYLNFFSFFHTKYNHEKQGDKNEFELQNNCSDIDTSLVREKPIIAEKLAIS